MFKSGHVHVVGSREALPPRAFAWVP